ncbi:FecR family protein [bacterium SCSIO 12696]|nr:FecR family protein [bacterium SCSIO 12696]
MSDFEMDNSNSDSKLFDIAMQWRLRLDSEPENRTVKQKFNRWIEASELHRQAYEKTNCVWDELAPLENAMLSSLEVDKPVQPWWKQSFFMRTVAPAALACGLLVALTLALFPQQQNEPQSLHYSAATGDQYEVQLADGSTVHLNAQSSILITIADKKRHVTLEQGEVFFDIAHDSERPFTVEAGTLKVTVLGTAFNIYKSANRIDVTTLEGLVSVATESTEQGEPLRPGEQASTTSGTNGAIDIRKVDTAKITAWRNNMLVFENTPISQFIADINRYLPSALTVDPSLDEQRISGAINVADADGILDNLELTFKVKTIINNDGQLTLIPADYKPVE